MHRIVVTSKGAMVQERKRKWGVSYWSTIYEIGPGMFHTKQSYHGAIKELMRDYHLI